ncbi:MAG: AzlD family protein [Desulfovibrio sp.]|uniref:AzlD family protein n=1 Tax=Desulfovibrio sp. 7SRBS1 TaxID=3378064 RepID=UPI003B3F795A
METNSLTLLTIILMGVGTYITRSSGLFLASRLNLGPRGEAFMKAVPGGILVALVAPTALSSSWGESVAALVTVGVAALSRNLLISMIAGVGTICLIRHFVL